jgi:ABC-type Zn2+ transport system substrate-binding protein/surface adhesin
MLNLLALQTSHIRALAMLVAVSVMLCAATSKGLAGENPDGELPNHHGLMADHGHHHDHDHDDQQSDDLDHKGGSSAAHVHFEAFFQAPSSLQLLTTDSEISAQKLAELILNCRTLFERPPKVLL